MGLSGAPENTIEQPRIVLCTGAERTVVLVPRKSDSYRGLLGGKLKWATFEDGSNGWGSHQNP